MTSLVVSAVGADRPGIVAAVSRVLFNAGANIEDSSMTILRGHFAMTLVVAGEVTAAGLEEALAPAAHALDLRYTVRELAGDEPTRAAAAPYVASVYGADRFGIVAEVTGLLAQRRVNITDVRTRLQGAPGAELYVMVLGIDVPDAVDAGALEADLRALASRLHVEATLHPADPDIL